MAFGQYGPVLIVCGRPQVFSLCSACSVVALQEQVPQLITLVILVHKFGHCVVRQYVTNVLDHPVKQTACTRLKDGQTYLAGFPSSVTHCAVLSCHSWPGFRKFVAAIPVWWLWPLYLELRMWLGKNILLCLVVQTLFGQLLVKQSGPMWYRTR